MSVFRLILAVFNGSSGLARGKQFLGVLGPKKQGWKIRAGKIGSDGSGFQFRFGSCTILVSDAPTSNKNVKEAHLLIVLQQVSHDLVSDPTHKSLDLLSQLGS